MAGPLGTLRIATRGLLRRPRFTLPALATLALGLAATTAVFTVVDTTLLRPLPYPEPDRLVGFWGQGSWAAGELDFVRQQTSSFSAVGAFDTFDLPLQGERPQVLPAAEVSHDLLEVLGVSAVLGRTFSEAEEQPGRGNVVLVSERLWHRDLGSDPDVVGRELELAGQTFEVVGVMPEGFDFPTRDTALWVPLTLDPSSGAYSGNLYLRMIGRLADGVTLQQARHEVRAMVPALQEAFDLEPGFDKLAAPADVEPLLSQSTRGSRQPLWTLLAISGLLLVIGCANVAQLLLAQAVHREREMAIRGALGANRGALVGQLLAEALVLAAAAGGLALLMASWVVDALRLWLPADTPRLATMTLDGRALAFGGLVTLATVIVFGSLPALHGSRHDLRHAMGQGAGAGLAPGRRRLRRGLVLAQTALATVLTLVSISTARSFVALAGEDAGFEGDSVVTLRPELAGSEWQGLERNREYHRLAVERLAQQPEVVTAGAIWRLPIAQQGAYQILEVEGREKVPGETPFVYWRAISGDYFETLGIPLLEGRALGSGDRADTEQVGVINRTMAETFWPDGGAVGRRIKNSIDSDAWVTIVGVVADVRHEGLRNPAEFTLYRPLDQSPHWVDRMALVARVEGDPEAALGPLGAALRGLAPSVPVHQVSSFRNLVSESIARERLTGAVATVYGALALALAAVGIFGLLSFSLGERRREIGIRRVLGAQRARLLRQVVGEGLVPVLAGLGVGLLLAWPAEGLLASWLYEIRANDPASLVLVTATLLTLALVASWLPARRAVGVELVEVLREE